MESTCDQNNTNNTNNPATPTTINPTAPTNPEVMDEDIIVAFEKLSTMTKRPLSTAEITFFKAKDPTAEYLMDYCKLAIQQQL